MTIVPVQCWGIGDIIFEQTVVRKVAGDNPILWPVEPQFLDGLTRAYPDLKFVDKRTLLIDYERKDDYIWGDMRMLPLRWADSICKVPYSDCMKSKYMLYGMEWQSWRVHAMWQRDGQKEYELRNHLRLPSKYNLINRNFGSQSQLKAAIEVDNGLPNINMHTIEGFSLFDWAYVIENATEIHTVSTSIIYIMEMLQIRSESVHLYPRRPIEQGFENVEYILQKHRYEFHY